MTLVTLWFRYFLNFEFETCILLFRTRRLCPQCFAFLNCRHAFLQPDRRRCPFQIMIEELLHANLPVLFVVEFGRPVRLVVVVDQPDRFTQAPERHKKLDALVPGHMAVVVVVHDEQRRLDFIRPEDRRVFHVAHGVFPQRTANAALSALVLKHPAPARSPADAAISAGHVRDRRAGFGSFENIRPGHHKGDLIPAPTVPLHPDVFFIYKALFN